MMRADSFEIARLRQLAAAHDDYMGALRTMQARQREMTPLAQAGDAYARGYLAALHEFSLAVQAELARRIR